MNPRIAIIGVGQTPCRPVSPEVSFKELVYQAALRAYQDAGLDPRRDIDSFVTVAEDFSEGLVIADCYTPDQLGAVLRPLVTVAGDGLQGLITAYMQIASGVAKVVVLEGHSKASNLLTPAQVTAFAADPIFVQPLGLHPLALAGLEMNCYLKDSGATREQCAAVRVKNAAQALESPWAAYGARLTVAQVLASGDVARPLTRLDLSLPADGAVVLVLASEERARSLSPRPVWVRGLGLCSDSPNLDSREWGEATYARIAAERAYKMAGIAEPQRQIHLAEVDDTFSYKELQHLEALGLCPKGEAGPRTLAGATARGGELPVNLSGGSLGSGHLGDASGLTRAAAAVRQLRGEAGRSQVAGATTALVQSWRGLPTASGAVAILSREG